MNRETSRNLENKKHACFTGITKISIKCNLCHIHYISIMFLNHLANMFLESPLIFLGHLATKRSHEVIIDSPIRVDSLNTLKARPKLSVSHKLFNETYYSI